MNSRLRSFPFPPLFFHLARRKNRREAEMPMAEREVGKGVVTIQSPSRASSCKTFPRRPSSSSLGKLSVLSRLDAALRLPFQTFHTNTGITAVNDSPRCERGILNYHSSTFAKLTPVPGIVRPLFD